MNGVDAVGARLAVERLVAGSARVLAPMNAGVSAGVAQLVPGEPTENAIARADAALYRCKRRGGLLFAPPGASAAG